MEQLRFPIGKFTPDRAPDEQTRRRCVEDLRHLPALLREAIRGLSDERLATPYREGGWTVRQLVHHLADSHLNAYLRCRLLLTEENPTIKPYDEERWAELDDARNAPVELSLVLLDALHARWVLLMESLADDAWTRTLQHPIAGTMSLDVVLQLYSWHGRHHVAHVTALREREGW